MAFIGSAKRILREGIAAARRHGISGSDYRAMLCHWEDALFARFPEGHRILDIDAAADLVRRVFEAAGRTLPELHIVSGFEDPRVGGFADVDRHRILIEQGSLYRFLILHESAHLLVPEDRLHGPAFIYVLQNLYRTFIGIPESAIAELLRAHELPSYTAVPGAEPEAVAA